MDNGCLLRTMVPQPTRSRISSIPRKELSFVYGFCTPCWFAGGDFTTVRFHNEKYVMLL